MHTIMPHTSVRTTLCRLHKSRMFRLFSHYKASKFRILVDEYECIYCVLVESKTIHIFSQMGGTRWERSMPSVVVVVDCYHNGMCLDNIRERQRSVRGNYVRSFGAVCRWPVGFLHGTPGQICTCTDWI